MFSFHDSLWTSTEEFLKSVVFYLFIYLSKASSEASSEAMQDVPNCLCRGTDRSLLPGECFATE